MSSTAVNQTPCVSLVPLLPSGISWTQKVVSSGHFRMEEFLWVFQPVFLVRLLQLTTSVIIAKFHMLLITFVRCYLGILVNFLYQRQFETMELEIPCSTFSFKHKL